MINHFCTAGPGAQYVDYPANLSSDAVDAQLGMTGSHGFSIDIPAAARDFSVFLVANNVPGCPLQKVLAP